MTPIELAAGEAWAAGENGERFDENNLSKTIEAADPATVPYIIMIRPRGASCPAAGACGSIYPAYVSASTAATWYEARGSLRLSTKIMIIYVTDIAVVLGAIDKTASLWPEHRGHPTVTPHNPPPAGGKRTPILFQTTPR